MKTPTHDGLLPSNYQARSSTSTSPVIIIENLVFWVESTLENSFSEEDLASDPPKINSWKDINPLSSEKYDLDVFTNFQFLKISLNMV